LHALLNQETQKNDFFSISFETRKQACIANWDFSVITRTVYEAGIIEITINHFYLKERLDKT